MELGADRRGGGSVRDSPFRGSPDGRGRIAPRLRPRRRGGRNGPNHDLEHLPAIGRLTGLEGRADELAQQISVTVQSGSFSDFDAGTMVYNLACFAARDGRLSEARPMLRRAFALRLDLRDFAKEDPDLLELRDELAQLTPA